MRLIKKKTGEEVVVGDKVSATLPTDTAPGTFIIHKIWEPYTRPSNLVARNELGLIEINFIRKGDIGSWKQFCPYVLGLEFQE